VEGKKHDYRMFKELFPPSVEIFPENTTFWMGLGFIGIDKDYPSMNIMMPNKKPKGKELSD